MQILDRYVTSAPCIQNALDIFKDEWSSSLPGHLKSLKAGSLLLFNDPRIQWAVEKFGGVRGKRVLELGPLEAGHTYMLEKLGASSILAVEANTRAYLKCLLVKEIVGLTRAHFLCGDFVEYLRTSPEKFDICIASGVLYHMLNPVELLTLMSQISDKIFIWTHYYEADIIAGNAVVAPKFTESKSSEWAGFQHTLYRYEYQTALDSAGFCGGSNPFSYWMSRTDILSYLQHLGFADIDINFEMLDHPNGPCFALTAIRQQQTTDAPISSSQSGSIEIKLDKMEWQLQQTQRELERSQTELSQTQQELAIARQTIAAMQSSKFWKLRQQWFNLKKRVGLGKKP